MGMPVKRGNSYRRATALAGLCVLLSGCTFGRYSLPARRAVSNALTVAKARGHVAIYTEDLLLGLAAADPPLLDGVRLKTGLAPDAIVAAVNRIAPARAASEEIPAGLPVSPDLQKVLDLAGADSPDRVTTRHLLLALLRGPGSAAGVLKTLGVTETAVRAAAETNQDE